jgi:hydrogenase maturation protease
MKTIVVGIGNPILGDDGVGIHVIRALQQHQQFPSDITVEEAQTGGMNLLDLITGFDHAILVDAVSFSDCEHGMINRFDISELPTVHSQNPHDVSLPEALDLAKSLGHASIPQTITIIGVNLSCIPKTFSESLSDEIKACIPRAVDLVLYEISKIKKQQNNMKKNT